MRSRNRFPPVPIFLTAFPTHHKGKPAPVSGNCSDPYSERHRRRIQCPYLSYPCCPVPSPGTMKHPIHSSFPSMLQASHHKSPDIHPPWNNFCKNPHWHRTDIPRFPPVPQAASPLQCPRNPAVLSDFLHIFPLPVLHPAHTSRWFCSAHIQSVRSGMPDQPLSAPAPTHPAPVQHWLPKVSRPWFLPWPSPPNGDILLLFPTR